MEEQLDPAADVQLTEDITQVGLYGFLADLEPGRDLLIPHPLDHPLDDLLLPSS